jgi:hypothetical protein
VTQPALRALHEKMAALAIDEHTFQILGMLPDVPLQVLHAACDPSSGRLLAWSIYRGIAVACTGGEHGADRIMPFYIAAKAARDQVGAAPAVVRETVNSFSAIPIPKELAEQPTVPKLKLPLAPVGGYPSRTPTLQEIRTKRDYAGYIKDLVVQSGLTLRGIEENTRKLDPKAVCCRSTLSDTLRHGKIPTGEPVMATLLTVLFAFITHSEPGTDTVHRSTHEALRVWRQLLRPPSGAPVLVAGGIDPLLRQALTELAHAEKTATRLGSPDAPGLAHAQRILRELLT